MNTSGADRPDNKRLVTAIFAALARGDGAPLVAAMSPGIRWHVIGSTSWSRTFDGKEEVRRGLLGPLMHLMDGGYRNVAKRIVTEDDTVVVLAQGDARTRRGDRYDNSYCFVMRLRDGRIEEITEYSDTALIERVLLPLEEAQAQLTEHARLRQARNVKPD